MLVINILESIFLLLILLLFNVKLYKTESSLSDFDGLLLNLGQGYNLTTKNVISHENLRKILAGVESGNKDATYYFALLKMYGITVTRNMTIASEHFQKAATLGHVEAHTAYGVVLLSDRENPDSEIIAMRYFRKAIEMNDLNAPWLLAKLLINSRNESTYDEAFTLLNKAADKFVPDAEFHLAIMYEYGLGIPVNFDKAIEYYRRAGEKSHLDAIYHLALMYADGRGHPQDFRKASSLLERAAADNHAPSTYFMGVFKFHGYGCMPNYDLALQWFERAAAIGDFRIQEAAENATQELSQLLDLAKKHNDNIIEKYQILSERNDD